MYDVHYTSEKNCLILISLLKKSGIRKIVASPGTTNMSFVASVQSDSWFQVYSCVDERSAAYMACGMAAESGETVVLSCTGATASRNYLSALTEAYYRKLPILVVTSTQQVGRIGMMIPQVIDRSVCQNDVVRMSVLIRSIYGGEDEWNCIIGINKAIAALKRGGGGPVHINLETTYSRDFSIRTLPDARLIEHFSYSDKMPDLPEGKIAIWVGSHAMWSQGLVSAVERFCERYGAVVFADLQSNYTGKYAVNLSLVCFSKWISGGGIIPKVLISIGEISGGNNFICGKETQLWRVSPDGEIRDGLGRATRYVFEMGEIYFFNAICRREGMCSTGVSTYLNQCMELEEVGYSALGELPFSNAWIASCSSASFPSGSVVHLGILNSLRVWNLFKKSQNVSYFSNTGGFGIDGNLSTVIGASFVNPEKLYFAIVGDLSFFYDINSTGNRHIGRNLRVMVINNGRGTEFRLSGDPFGERADAYISAAGHFANKSVNLLRDWATNVGFKYLSASNKDEYYINKDEFFTPGKGEKPVIFEIFTDSKDETEAQRVYENCGFSEKKQAVQTIKNVAVKMGASKIKRAIKRII